MANAGRVAPYLEDRRGNAGEQEVGRNLLGVPGALVVSP